MIDVEALVVTWLAGRLGGIRVLAELPARFEEALPVVQVTCLPGPKLARPWNDRRPLLWRPRVDLDTYATTRAAATDLASTVSDHLIQLAGQGNQWGQVADVEEPAGPAWRPDYNPSVRRSGLTVELTIRAD
ncbi:hypothetical protein [Amycolatopsis vastitatis]|uniref:DUF3168 domain-containing protein n=1 Tax=Amycolatopsis vastitatis TaxID=1905142 RepID=A0A229TEN7_9PSEU|nr:hypothetical protein [Amycolatopsis vastitatis]OXM69628.1 hypothetical protein CF165_08960 [Amycolatopsis vastitatis]